MKVISGFLKDCLFPIFCVSCGREGYWWCSYCRSCKLLGVYQCPICTQTTNGGTPCRLCAQHSALTSIVALFSYQKSEPAAELIREFKYKYTLDMAELWGILLRSFVIDRRCPVGDLDVGTVAIPVPLFHKRERERGFNQAEVLAEIVAKHLAIPLMKDALYRIRSTAQQAQLNRAERLANVVGAFVWQGRVEPPPMVVLVDDVYTTGATMQECARVLKAVGVRSVFGFTLGRG